MEKNSQLLNSEISQIHLLDVIVRSGKKSVSVVNAKSIHTFVGDWSTKISHILNFGIVKFYEIIYLRFLQG